MSGFIRGEDRSQATLFPERLDDYVAEDSAAAMITIRRDAGEDAEAEELLAAIKDSVRRYHQAGIIGSKLVFSVDFEEGLAAYLAGQREKGLALIARAAEKISDSLTVKFREKGFNPTYTPGSELGDAWLALQTRLQLPIMVTFSDVF